MQFLSSSLFPANYIAVWCSYGTPNEPEQSDDQVHFLSDANILIIIFTIFGFKDLDVIEEYEIYKKYTVIL